MWNWIAYRWIICADIIAGWRLKRRGITYYEEDGEPLLGRLRDASTCYTLHVTLSTPPGEVREESSEWPLAFCVQARNRKALNWILRIQKQRYGKYLVAYEVTNPDGTVENLIGLEERAPRTCPHQ
ncbi:MAG: hypothetical protein WCO52_02160 [bacterium]